jgi:hypothetical protein
MSIKVVVGEAKPSSDLARRLAMVYELLLRRAEEAEAGERMGKQSSAGENPAVTPATTSEKPDFVIE